MRPLPPAKKHAVRRASALQAKVGSVTSEIYKTNPIFLSDWAVFVIKPAGGQCRERFTGVGEDGGRAR